MGAVPPGEGHSVVCLAAAIKCFNVLSLFLLLAEREEFLY